jgi:flagellar assembly protein FliH
VLHEVSISRETVLEVVKQAIESAQSDEKVTVRVSPQDFAFIESIKEKLGKDFDALKRSKIEASDDVADGGCVIETNYGDVNATVEQKLEKLWETISEKLPRIKNAIGG